MPVLKGFPNSQNGTHDDVFGKYTTQKPTTLVIVANVTILYTLYKQLHFLG